MWQCDYNVKNETPMFQPMIARSHPPSVANMMGDPYVTIFCGPLTARLHLQYFQCPGIHQPCIEFDGEMITPKEFCFRANKDKQKDWKGSIRAGKRTLRYMMEIKAIEFYNHVEVCSGKCQSRNHVYGRDIKPEVKRPVPVPTYPMRPMYSSVSGYTPYPTPSLHLPSSPFQMQSMQNIMPLLPPQQSLMTSSPPSNGDHVQEDNVSPTMLAAACVGRSFAATTDENQPPPGVMSAKQLLGYIDTDPLMFWTETRRVGLMGEFINTINDNVTSSCTAASDVNNNLAQVCPTLSRLLHAVNLQQFVISRIQSHQSDHFTKNADDLENNASPVKKASEQNEQSPPVLMHIGVPEAMNSGANPTQLEALGRMEQQLEHRGSAPNNGTSPSRPLKRRSVLQPNLEDVKKVHLLELE